MRNILNIRQLRNMFAAAMFSVLALCFCNRISAIELNENSAESNIAPNSSFEIQKGGSAVPDNWTFWNDGDSKAVLSNESPHSGKNCVKLTSKQKAMTRVFSRVIKVTAGQPYVFSAYLKGQPGGWGLSVVFENEKAEYLGGTPMHYVKVTGKWKKFEMKFVPESGFVKLFIQGNSASDNDCSIWVDDINFVKFDKNQKLNMERERELKKKEDIVTKITQQKLELLKIKQAIRAASTHGFVSLIAKNSLEAAESTLKTAAQQLSEEKNFDQVYELIYKTDCSLAKAKGFLTAVKFPRWAKQVIFNYLNVQENVITKGLTKERFQEEIAATPSYAKGFLF
ncbi:MAG: carbohydrate binding domain-containing protein, partial [Victivallales bacterium]